MFETGVTNRIRDLFIVFREPDRTRGERIKEIARAIWEYGALIRHECPDSPMIVVNSREIAFRFREKAKDVSKALALLESDGQASSTQAGDWLLKM